jgi:hypothetical protein
MTKFLISGFTALLTMLLSAASVLAQSAGTLSFTFTCLPHTSYTASKNVMAVWIESSTGAFVKTRTRNVGNGTRDHLPTWAVNAGGPSNNALSTLCNVVGATSGATLSSFGAHTVTWDGTNAAGTQMPDGTYKILIQETWNHGTARTATRIFTFTKGNTTDAQTPATDANFSNLSLTWTPNDPASVNQGSFSESGVKIYPNPSSDGHFFVTFTSATQLEVYNQLGAPVKQESCAGYNGKMPLDLSSLESGFYFVQLRDGLQNPILKVILNK